MLHSIVVKVDNYVCMEYGYVFSMEYVHSVHTCLGIFKLEFRRYLE